MMGTSTNTFQISGASPRHNGVTGAIQQASAKTGVDFGYLVKQANVESSMNPNAKARTSSATGLYQFIEQTWLRMVKEHGAEHGYGKFANAITQGRDGEYHVSNRGTRNAILNLRKDPQASSLMAAELATENDAFLRSSAGVEPSGTDLYLAHFMGAQGASNFLKSMQKNPWAPAASIFPEAARSNRNIFYAQGKPLSLQAIYNRFDAKFQGNSAAPVVQTDVASAARVENGNVVLPGADSWSNPNSVAAARADHLADSQPSFVRAFTSQNTDALKTADASSSGFGRMVQWPVDAMLDAQSRSSRFVHNDGRRYNS